MEIDKNKSRIILCTIFVDSDVIYLTFVEIESVTCKLIDSINLT